MYFLVKPSCITQTSPPKDDILFHEHQLLAHEPVITQEIKELQERKALEQQYHQIASKLSADQQALLQLHTGIAPSQLYQDDLYGRYSTGYSSLLDDSKAFARSNSNSQLYLNSAAQPRSMLRADAYSSPGILSRGPAYRNPSLANDLKYTSGQYVGSQTMGSNINDGQLYPGTRSGYSGQIDTTNPQGYMGGSYKTLDQGGPHYGSYNVRGEQPFQDLSSSTAFPYGDPSFLQPGVSMHRSV